MIAINFREDDDELIGAELVDSDDDILLVSRKGQSIRFRADDGQLRPMGRATSGVSGMKFRDGDSLLSMSVIRAEQVAAEQAASVADGATGGDVPDVAEQYVFTITDGGFAKRTPIAEYRQQSRGGLGIKAMKQDDDRGELVGAFIVVEGDEVLAIKQSGQVTRSAIDEHLRPTGRDTKGVKFVGVSNGDSVAVVARSVERAPEIEEAVEEAVEQAGGELAAEAAVQAAAAADVDDSAVDATIEVGADDTAAQTEPDVEPRAADGADGETEES